MQRNELTTKFFTIPNTIATENSNIISNQIENSGNTNDPMDIEPKKEIKYEELDWKAIIQPLQSLDLKDITSPILISFLNSPLGMEFKRRSDANFSFLIQFMEKNNLPSLKARAESVFSIIKRYHYYEKLTHNNPQDDAVLFMYGMMQIEVFCEYLKKNEKKISDDKLMLDKVCQFVSEIINGIQHKCGPGTVGVIERVNREADILFNNNVENLLYHWRLTLCEQTINELMYDYNKNHYLTGEVIQPYQINIHIHYVKAILNALSDKYGLPKYNDPYIVPLMTQRLYQNLFVDSSKKIEALINTERMLEDLTNTFFDDMQAEFELAKKSFPLTVIDIDEEGKTEAYASTFRSYVERLNIYGPSSDTTVFTPLDDLSNLPVRKDEQGLNIAFLKWSLLYSLRTHFFHRLTNSGFLLSDQTQEFVLTDKNKNTITIYYYPNNTPYASYLKIKDPFFPLSPQALPLIPFVIESYLADDVELHNQLKDLLTKLNPSTLKHILFSSLDYLTSTSFTSQPDDIKQKQLETLSVLMMDLINKENAISTAHITDFANKIIQNESLIVLLRSDSFQYRRMFKATILGRLFKAASSQEISSSIPIRIIMKSIYFLESENDVEAFFKMFKYTNGANGSIVKLFKNLLLIAIEEKNSPFLAVILKKLEQDEEAKKILLADTAILHALCRSSANMMASYLEAGANPNLMLLTSSQALTPLVVAASCGNLEAIDVLIKKGADTTVKVNGKSFVAVLDQHNKRKNYLQGTMLDIDRFFVYDKPYAFAKTMNTLQGLIKNINTDQDKKDHDQFLNEIKALLAKLSEYSDQPLELLTTELYNISFTKLSELEKNLIDPANSSEEKNKMIAKNIQKTKLVIQLIADHKIGFHISPVLTSADTPKDYAFKFQGSNNASPLTLALAHENFQLVMQILDSMVENPEVNANKWAYEFTLSMMLCSHNTKKMMDNFLILFQKYLKTFPLEKILYFFDALLYKKTNLYPGYPDFPASTRNDLLQVNEVEAIILDPSVFKPEDLKKLAKYLLKAGAFSSDKIIQIIQKEFDLIQIIEEILREENPQVKVDDSNFYYFLFKTLPCAPQLIQKFMTIHLPSNEGNFYKMLKLHEKDIPANLNGGTFLESHRVNYFIILINNGIKLYPDNKQTKANCPLFYAVERHHPELVKALLNRNDINLDIKDSKGNNAFQKALLINNEDRNEIIIAFLSSGDITKTKAFLADHGICEQVGKKIETYKYMGTAKPWIETFLILEALMKANTLDEFKNSITSDNLKNELKKTTDKSKKTKDKKIQRKWDDKIWEDAGKELDNQFKSVTTQLEPSESISTNVGSLFSSNHVTENSSDNNEIVNNSKEVKLSSSLFSFNSHTQHTLDESNRIKSREKTKKRKKSEMMTIETELSQKKNDKEEDEAHKKRRKYQ